MTIHKNIFRAVALAGTALAGVFGILQVAEAAATANNIGTIGIVPFGGDAAAIVRGNAGVDVTAGTGFLTSLGGTERQLVAHLFNSNGKQKAVRLIGYNGVGIKLPGCVLVHTVRGTSSPPLQTGPSNPACRGAQTLSVKVFDGTNLPNPNLEPNLEDLPTNHQSTYVGP
jgi:hypothetical protein